MAYGRSRRLSAAGNGRRRCGGYEAGYENWLRARQGRPPAPPYEQRHRHSSRIQDRERTPCGAIGVSSRDIATRQGRACGRWQAALRLASSSSLPSVTSFHLCCCRCPDIARPPLLIAAACERQRGGASNLARCYDRARSTSKGGRENDAGSRAPYEQRLRH